MNIRIIRQLTAGAMLLCLSGLAASAEEPRPFSEGPVTHVSYVKIKPGMFDAYLKWLDTDYKQIMEAYKKQGIILDYKVFETNEAHSPSEPDLMLTVIYKNMAAFDGLRDRTEPITNKQFGSRQQASAAAVSRESMREILGDRLIRELILK